MAYYFELLLLAGAALYILYKWTTSTFKTFEERGIPYVKPWPLVGNNLGLVLAKKSFQKHLMEVYLENKSHKIFGFFNFRTPMFSLHDPEYIKKITVKDFEYFPNHQNFFKSDEPMLADMLSLMKDQRWKDMRNTLTPIFTAAKMRAMFNLMNECFDESIGYLKEKSVNGASFDVELKEICNKLSNDLIASTAFGLKVNSYKDPNNIFFRIGQSVAFFRGKQMFKFFVATTTPWLMKVLGLRIFDAEKTGYFMRLVIDTMKYREEHKIVRPDMIQLLMEAKKDSDQNWSDVEIVAQCFIFFFAAFENNANFICTTSYELVMNPKVQQKLYEEVMDVYAKLDGTPLNYDAINKMKYMDMVTQESLRKWSLAGATDRVCSKDYTLLDEDGNKVFDFKAGDHINLPIIGLHWDDQYFKSPEVFDPERFSDENKHKIQPYTYLPFGVGPRICIGNRYALMQAKAMLYYLLLNFQLERSKKTVENLLDDTVGFQLAPKSGYWMKLVPRKASN